MAAMAATMPVMTVATVTGPVAVSRGVQTCLRCSRCGGAAAAGRSGSEHGGRWLMVEVEVCSSGHGHHLQVPVVAALAAPLADFKWIRARRESDFLPLGPWSNLPLELRGVVQQRSRAIRTMPFGRTLVLYPGALLLLPSVLQRGSDR